MAMLTDRQEEILEFVRARIRESGVPPTVREVQQAFRFSSPNAAARHLKALETKGVIIRAPGRARSLTLADAWRADPNEVPIYGTIPAGLPDDAETQVEGCVRVDPNTIRIPKNTRTFALRVRGDSMTGAHILNGDIVILSFESPTHGKIVAALIDGETTLKRYLTRSGKPYLKAENPKYPDLIPARELVIQGVMVGLVRNV